MQRVIVDSSVAVAWVLDDEPAHDAAVRFRRSILDGDLEPDVAGHFGFEVRGALTRAARRARVSWDSIEPRIAAIEAFAPTVHPLNRDDGALLELCREFAISWADAHWVALAASLDRPLVTADARPARLVPDTTAIVVLVEDGVR